VKAGDAQKALAELVPKDAHVVREDDSIDILPVSDLKVRGQCSVSGWRKYSGQWEL